jgi:uncharacterized protein YigE (DUF2233 family)
MKKLVLSLFLCLLVPAVHGADARFTVVSIDPAKQDLHLFLNDEGGRPFKAFARLAGWLEERGKRLEFGVNAGMYHHDFSPVGLLVIDGKQLAPLNLADGAGNFFMKPNGVFMLTKQGPSVVQASAYAAAGKDVLLATQSGPMLVIDGKIHPQFNAESQSRYVRNGVGVSGGKAIFVVSNHAVTFHEMAAFFRDVLRCKNALYLDGSVSSLYSRELGRNDAVAPLGPILGVVRTLP